MSRAGSLVWTERWKRIGIGISPFRSILHLLEAYRFFCTYGLRQFCVHHGMASGNAKRKHISRGELYDSWSAGGDWGVGDCEVEISSPI